MKNLLLLIITLLSMESFSQKLDIYTPLRTYHFDRRENTLNKFREDEGGNLGVIGIYTSNNKNLSLGVIRNSYGDVSVVSTIGYEHKLIKNVQIGYNIGVATGYDKYYLYRKNNGYPGVLQNNGILPVVTTTLEYNKYKIKPFLIISPVYLNFELKINIFELEN